MVVFENTNTDYQDNSRKKNFFSFLEHVKIIRVTATQSVPLNKAGLLKKTDSKEIIFAVHHHCSVSTAGSHVVLRPAAPDTLTAERT